ncbi:hypothetical protein [Arcanobacterium haemolyticum]|nr:hypothetical protein [Arcanobacterium haemolyticum]
MTKFHDVPLQVKDVAEKWEATINGVRAGKKQARDGTCQGWEARLVEP